MNYFNVNANEPDEMKSEIFSGICQCCLSESDLKSMLQPFVFDNREEVYSDMLTACFSIEVLTSEEDKLYLICERCILKLRDCYLFRNQIEDVQRKIKYQGHYSDDDTVTFEAKEIKSELFSDEENYDITFDDSVVGKKKKLTPIKNGVKRTKRKLIKSAKIEKSYDTKKLASQTKNKKNNKKSNSNKNVKKKEPKDQAVLEKERRERRLFLNKLRNAKKLPFKLDASAVTCNICKESFPTHKHLVCHMAVHYPNHICDLCGKLYVSKDRLISHITMTHDDEKIPCQICHKLLKKYSMPRHVRSHTGDNDIYSCRFCSEKFISYSTRIIHMKAVHDFCGSEYKCKMCPKTFKISGYLSKHVRRDHFNEKKHVCSVCHHGFFTSYRLNLHMVTHTGEKNFQCQVCLKSYARKQTLSAHMKIHNNIKQHVCNICGRSFTQKCTLQSHMRVHEKLYAQN